MREMWWTNCEPETSRTRGVDLKNKQNKRNEKTDEDNQVENKFIY